MTRYGLTLEDEDGKIWLNDDTDDKLQRHGQHFERGGTIGSTSDEELGPAMLNCCLGVDRMDGGLNDENEDAERRSDDC